MTQICVFTFSSWIRSSICLEAASCALNRLTVLVSSGSRMFPSLSLTTRSRSKYLELHKKGDRRWELISWMRIKRTHQLHYIILIFHSRRASTFRPQSSPSALSPAEGVGAEHSMLPTCSQCISSTSSLNASAEAKAISPPGQRFKVSSQEQNGASRFSFFNSLSPQMQCDLLCRTTVWWAGV